LRGIKHSSEGVGAAGHPGPSKSIRRLPQLSDIEPCVRGADYPGLLLPAQNSLDLLEMIEVVTGEHLGDAFDGFDAPLGVDSVMAAIAPW